MNTNLAAVDFEAFFDDECSIKLLGTDGYILHPKFYVYLVSIAASNGLEYVGPVDGAPWDLISGDDWDWCAHNASLDERVHYYLQKWGNLSAAVCPRIWHCTADLCAFHALPRSLQKAAKFKYDIKVPKDYRALMKGKHYAHISQQNREKVNLAGITDARICLRFAQDLLATWPERERRISVLSRQQGWHGYRVDVAALESDIELLKSLKWEAQRLIPWHGTANATLAYESLVEECKKVGIEAPASTAMTSDDCAEWEDKYGDQYPWIDALRTVRRSNALLLKCETMYTRVRPEDGRMPYQNKYFGAHTGRWGDGSEESGQKKDTGFNSRNLPRKEMFGEDYFLGKLNKDGTRQPAEGARFAHIWIPGRSKGVNLRHRIIPAEGCHFPIADLSQIEPRCLWRAVGDYDSLGYCKKGMSPYEAYMRSKMGYEGPPVKDVKDFDETIAALYQLAKAQVLALGYGAGYLKFIQMAPQYVGRELAEKIFLAAITEQDRSNFEDYLGWCKVADWNIRWEHADERQKTIYVNSWKIVDGYRKSNPKIASKHKKYPGIWKMFDNQLHNAIGKDLIVTLPSGRYLTYRKIALEGREITGQVIQYGQIARVKLYGGKLTENYIQAVARDVFVERMLDMDDQGLWVAGHVHDEVVPEVALAVSTKEVEKIMSKSPTFWPDLPVGSECKSHMHYTK